MRFHERPEAEDGEPTVHGEREKQLVELTRLFHILGIGDVGVSPWNTVVAFRQTIQEDSLFVSLHRLLEMKDRVKQKLDSDRAIGLWVILYGYDGPLGEMKRRY